MKNFLLSLCLSIALIKPLSAQKVAGFFPDWLANPTAEISRLQLDYLTDIYYAFLFPNTPIGVSSLDKSWLVVNRSFFFPAGTT